MKCPFEEPFEMVKEQICVSNCTIMERKDKLCITNYRGNISNDEVQNKVMANIQDDIIDTFDFHYVNENVSIIIEEIDNTYEILTTKKKKDIVSSAKTSTISLGQCETTLKTYYSIDENEPLYILKLDAYREGMMNPKVIYLVYYPLNGFNLEQLDLTLCEGDGVSLLFSTNITGDEDFYNKNSGYYNDICYTFTSDDGTDISLLDRQQKFIDNNQSLCEEGCEFVKYHYDKDMAECSCDIKTEAPLVSEIKIDKSALYKFVDIKKLANFDVMKCFNLLFDKNSIAKNIGLYIFFQTFIMYIICIIIFYKKEYLLIKISIEEIIKAKIKFKFLIEHGNKEGYYGDLTFLKSFLSKSILSKRLMNRSVKNKFNNIDNLDPENKNQIEINNKTNNIQFQNIEVEGDINPETSKTKLNVKTELNSNIFDVNEINFQPKSKDIFLGEKSKKKIKIKIKVKKKINKKNAPPSKVKRTLKNSNYLSNKIKQKNYAKDFILRKNLMTTKGIQNETEGGKDINNELNMIDKYSGAFSQEERDHMKIILKYNDNELNSMDYNNAVKNDHRSFFQFYFSLLKTKHMIITVFDSRDYNSRIIKIFLCFYNFASCYAINGLFFDDTTMHKIYEDKGEYNFLSQLPQIIYSTIIGYILDNLLNYLALPEDDIINIKEEKDIKHIEKKKNETLKLLHRKFIIFFIVTFLLLVLFWYYVGCFCAVNKNTQFHLFKDSLISFVTSMGTPFAIYLVPAIFRIPSLKRKNKANQIIFGLSKIIQFF